MMLGAGRQRTVRTALDHGPDKCPQYLQNSAGYGKVTGQSK
jgi:hypothetical protein